MEETCRNYEQSLQERVPMEVYFHCLSTNHRRFTFEFLKIRNCNLRKINGLINNSTGILTNEGSNNIFNYTDIAIPEDVSRIMNLEPNYGLPIQTKHLPIPGIIKDLEAALSKIKPDENDTRQKEDVTNEIRAKTANIITNFTRKSNTNHWHKSQITKDAIATRKFLKEHDELIVARSDKGNSTVIWYKANYLKKMHEMLNDPLTYLKLPKDPTSKYQTRANNIIVSLTKAGKLEKREARYLTTYNAVPPKIYGKLINRDVS